LRKADVSYSSSSASLFALTSIYYSFGSRAKDARASFDHKNFDYTKFIRSGNAGEGEKEFSTEVKNFYYSNLDKHIKPLLKKRGLRI